MATAILPRPPHLLGAPEQTLARVTLGLTAYLSSPGDWASRHVGEVLAHFLRVRDEERALLSWTSLDPRTRALGDDDTRWLGDALTGQTLLAPAPRHMFSVRLTDSIHAPEQAFLYREVSERSEATGWLRIHLPPTHPPSVIEGLVRDIGQRPVHSVTAGYVTSHHPRHSWVSYQAVLPWARRYWGLDVSSPEQGGWRAREGLVGWGWLTVVGRDLLHQRGVDPQALVTSGLDLEPWADAVLVRTGAVPSLADQNLMQHPAGWSRMAHALMPLVEHVELPGGFFERDVSGAWSRRWVEPEGWR